MQFLGLENTIILGAKLIGGFVASTVAILLWSQTREPSWVLIILATVLSYIQVLFEFLDKLGIFSLDIYQYMGVSVIRVAFAVIVPLLYAIGFLWAMRSIHRP